MNKEQIISFLKDLFVKFKKVSLFIILIALGYSLCEIYHYTQKPKQEVKKTKTSKETSVAINERGELMLIDRVTGEYELYQDSIGRSIFNIYANSIQSKYEDKTR